MPTRYDSTVIVDNIKRDNNYQTSSASCLSCKDYNKTSETCSRNPDVEFSSASDSYCDKYTSTDW